MKTILAKTGVPVIAVLVAAGCGVLAEDPNVPDPLPHGGTGQFRPLTSAETGISGSPSGRALALGGATGSGSVADGFLFYAAATLPEDAPEPTDPPVPGVVDWDAFEPRRIYRSPPGQGVSFVPGTEVIGPAAGEGALMEPCAVVTPLGEALLYYVTEGAIRVARAPRIDGTFVPVENPVLTALAGGPDPRRPSVARHPDGRYLLYFSAGRTIGLATSRDGIRFSRITDALDLGPDPVKDGSTEIGLFGPGVVRVRTPVGRELVRLYFESHRDDGRVLIMLAASEDGEDFERYDLPVLADEDRRLPAPVFIDERTTLLYLIAPRSSRDREIQALVATIAPRDAVVP